jgi:hypothetical protein
MANRNGLGRSLGTLTASILSPGRSFWRAASEPGRTEAMVGDSPGDTTMPASDRRVRASPLAPSERRIALVTSSPPMSWVDTRRRSAPAPLVSSTTRITCPAGSSRKGGTMRSIQKFGR